MRADRSVYEVIAGDRQYAWSETAMGWPVELDLRHTEPGNSRGPGVPQAHLICGVPLCRQSVFCLSVDTGAGAYVTTTATLAAAVLRHVREVHCDGGGNLL